MDTRIDPVKALTPATKQLADKQASLFCAAWVVTLLLSLSIYLFLLNHEGEAGAVANPPTVLPVNTIAPSDGKFSLLMFLHPKCPCSRASLNELAKILSRNPNVKATIVFFRPIYASQDWTETDVWHTAKSLPAEVKTDVSGLIARKFGAGTSGDTMLYDQEGKLLFHGGITLSRGHEGDNQGESIVNAFLTNSATPAKTCTPVFGCSLRSIASTERRE